MYRTQNTTVASRKQRNVGLHEKENEQQEKRRGYKTNHSATSQLKHNVLRFLAEQ